MPSDEFRICVTGGRDLTNVNLVDEAMDWVHASVLTKHGIGTRVKLAHGGASGADELCRDWANRCFGATNVRQFNAYWDANGPGAGPIRNATMLDEFKPHVLIAFPGGDGTADCVKKARARGIPVRDGVELAKKARGEEC